MNVFQVNDAIISCPNGYAFHFGIIKSIMIRSLVYW